MELKRGDHVGPQQCSGIVVECWLDNLVPLLPTKLWPVRFRVLVSGWGTFKQLLPWRLKTCVIQCLLALPDRHGNGLSSNLAMINLAINGCLCRIIRSESAQLAQCAAGVGVDLGDVDS